MPFKPFAHLARVSLAKGISHVYAPAVVAGQSIGGQFHNYPINKFTTTTKSSQLQNAFSGPSSSGAGAKASHASQSGGNDGGLGQYYAAWQHAQQTGDDTDWQQHQLARKIGWKPSEKSTSSSKRPGHTRLESLRTVDVLRQPARLEATRSDGEGATTESPQVKTAPTEAEALASIDEAIAQEIKDIQDANSIVEPAIEDASVVDSIEKPASEHDTSIDVSAQHSPATNLTSLVVDESGYYSESIVQLGQQQRYAEIPQLFESMVKDGLVPTVDAYNAILLSAIRLNNGYQPYPRALEVYGDMTSRSVLANQDTYAILISFLTKQSLEASQVQRDLAEQRLRYGASDGSFVLPSTQHQYELYAGDTSLQFATKFYNIACGSMSGFRLSAPQYNRLLQAYARTGSAQNMRQLLSDMRASKVPVTLELFTIVIDACASVKDIETAKECYRDYRDRAIGRILNPMDIEVYVSLIRAFYASGEPEEGINFYQKVLQSFEGSAEKENLSAQVTDAFVVDGLVQHHLEAGNYQKAIAAVEAYPVTDAARARAWNKITISAADNDKSDLAEKVYARSHTNEVVVNAAMAVSAMHFRANRLDEAKAAWARVQQFANAPAATVSFAAMYALSLVKAGLVEEGLTHVRAMFRQIRSASRTAPQTTNMSLDEAILLLGQMLHKTQAVQSAQASVLLFRLMIENGGLVAPITKDAIARLGPECVQQLSSQDIALALHVQAHMLPAPTATDDDSAQAARFAHLLETVLDRGILMDPSTLNAVSDALPRLGGWRLDLQQRWQNLMRPALQEPLSPQVRSPGLPQSPTTDRLSGGHFDPYANTTDHRASRVISDMLESTSGRIEGHIADAMSRLRNVRRMGRHLQYGTYAKLITTASKAKQSNLMHEILSMAQTDVPYNPQHESVKAGWVTIYDAMVAACLTVGERQLAAKYHQDLLVMGSTPSANTFGIYITTLEGTFDEATEAVKIFQQALSEGVQPTVFLFNAVIGKLGKARRIDDCLQYFGQMQSLGIRPSSVTYGTLVNALCRTSEESFAVEMFDEMETAPNYRPRPAPYNSIIQYFLNTKRDRSKVLQYYGRMRSKNIKPTSHTYKLLIESYATLEPINLTAAETVLEDMKANGVQPEAVHYGSLIHARGCVLGDMAGAKKVFDAVLADKSIRPTDNLYQNLLESMVANHQVEQTEAVLLDMKKRGIAMTPYIANTLIHGWAGKGDIAKAKTIFTGLGMDHREPSTYEAMTRAFLAVEDHAGAQNVVSEMLSKGYPSAVSEKVLALVGGNLV